MSLYVYATSLLAAIAWGVSPIFSKRGFEYGGTPFLVALIVIGTGNVLFWATLVVGGGVSGLFDVGVAGLVTFLAAGLFGTAVGRAATYSGIERVGASISSAVTATSPLWATVLAFVFLGETITLLQAFGVVLVVAGLATLTFSKGGDLGGWTYRDLAFPLLAAAAFSVGFVLRRYGLTTTPASTLEGVALNELGALVGMVGYIVATRTPLDLPTRRGYAYFAVTGFLSSVGLLLFFMALSEGRVAIVSALAGTSPLVATVVSALALRDLERVTLGVAVGAVVVVAGVTLITLAAGSGVA